MPLQVHPRVDLGHGELDTSGTFPELRPVFLGEQFRYRTPSSGLSSKISDSLPTTDSCKNLLERMRSWPVESETRCGRD